MPGWHAVLSRGLTSLYYHRVRVLHKSRIPASGPTLYVGLHRNGAVDGFVYQSILPRATFMISTQLRKSLLGRLFFAGIEVVRSKDEGDRGTNARALEQCRDLLKKGGELFILPEGTSSLGPRHLPFKMGAAQVVLDCVQAGIPVTVIPLGIHYERAWSFRSRVEVVVGSPISTGGSPASLREVHRRIETALENVGVNVETDERQEMIETLAHVSTQGTGRSYFRSLKSLEASVPEDVSVEWNSLQLLSWFGRTGFPVKNLWLSALALAVFGPLVLAAGLVNIVPLLGAFLAGRILPDGPNVVALWRILVGIPLLAFWVAALGILAAVFGLFWTFPLYLALTLLGTLAFRTAKDSLVALANFLFHPGSRLRMLDFRNHLLEALPDEPA